jgi:heme/copper-type cytochrome/quinol oxidase subunit 2
MAILGRRHLLMALAALFGLAWVGSCVAYTTLFNAVDQVPAELGGIVILILALFGAVNVMLLAIFAMLLLLWRMAAAAPREPGGPGGVEGRSAQA